jgi:amino acid adenylation domain-containing protein
VIDLCALAAEQAWQQAHCLSEQEGKRPCDLVQGPLLRTALLRLGPISHVFLLTLHHSITDGWSNEILLQELSLLYQAFVKGQPSPLAPLPVQYADYALWQREWLQGQALERQQVYWQTQLAGASTLALPTDHPRPTVQSYRGASLPVHLPLALSKGLVALSRREQVTLFMLLLASFQGVLARWSGQSDISVGTPIANRRQEQTEELIGFFVNTLVLRSDLSGNPSFVQLLERVRQVCLEAYAHQDVPFEKIVEVLAPQRDLSRSPLFQVMFALQNVPSGQMDLPEVMSRVFVDGNGSSQFEMTLELEEVEEGIRGSLEYNADLFTAETISRLRTSWLTLLEGVLQRPETPLAEVPLLSAEERQRLLVEWNATQVVFSRQGSLQEQFEQQVQRSPEAIALVFEEQQLSYAQLNRRANQLAHHLQALGVGPEKLVGVCLERSLELVIALLGVLKAGGAYVPLDPDYPAERLAFLLRDSQVSVLLAQWHSQGLFSTYQGQTLYLDSFWDSPRSTEVVSWPELPENVRGKLLAYMIYTSGSTGQPRGAMNTHEALINRLEWMQAAYQLGSGDRILQKTPSSFDVSVWEFFWPLLNGASLVLAVPGGHREGAYLLKVMQEQAISVLHFVPSMLQAFLQEPGLEHLLHVRHVISSGEALSSDLQKRFFACMHASLENLYGPTEAAIDVTAWSCERDHVSALVPIGRPIANIQIYLLDRYQQPVPQGAIGEIYIGGIGLARGYIRRADATAERFVPHPFAEQEGERLYRTGDFARYRADGAIEYLGRKDQQVKVRGFRIELGEIEAALQTNPAIREAVVLLREGTGTDKQLVAYVVEQPEERLFVQRLRQALRENLPAYMIPSTFVELKALPLTPNGKVDRRALPTPAEEPGENLHGWQKARTPLEELLVDLWSEVLGHRQIGIHDNFFELGGHSLLAMQLLAQVRKGLGMEVSLQALFEAPTVSEFALHVEQILRSGEERVLAPMTMVPRSSVLPLSYAQQQLWFLEQLESGNTTHLHSDAFHLKGTVNVYSLECALRGVIGRHEILRTTFVEHDGQPVQVIHPQVHFLLPVIDLQTLDVQHAQQQTSLLTLQERQHPCDLAQGPLLRAVLLRLEPTSQIFLLTLHQIATDSRSNQVLLHEVSTLYQAFIAEQSLQLEPPPLHYVDYAVWQRQWLQGEVLDFLLSYWTKQLGECRTLAFSTDKPAMVEMSNQRAIYTFELPSSTYQNLIALSHQEGMTLLMTMLTALQVVLRYYTGEQDVTFGIKIANRRLPETENMPGLFENVLALPVHLSDQETFQEILKRVRVTVLHACTYRDLPFEKLLEALHLEQHKRHASLINVLFELTGEERVPLQLLELPDVTVRPIDTYISMGQFDVAMSLMEKAGQLTGRVNYRTCMFRSGNIERLIRLFEAVLQNIVTRPDATIEQLEDMIDEEKHKKIAEEEKAKEEDIRHLKSSRRRNIALRTEI